MNGKMLEKILNCFHRDELCILDFLLISCPPKTHFATNHEEKKNHSIVVDWEIHSEISVK